MSDRKSPACTEEHEALRRALRELVEREVKPHVLAWEAAGAVPRALSARVRGGH